MIETLRDGISFTSKLTPLRLRNMLACYRSFGKAYRHQLAHHPAWPWSISVEPTTSCNLRCPECPSGLRAFSRPTGMLEMSTFKKLLDEIHGKLAYLTMYFQGEPYLNPIFFDAVRYAHSKNIYTSTSTNAHYLTRENAQKTIESGLSRIIISMDGTDQETYQTYRVGGQLDKVIEGIRHLTEAKKASKNHAPFIILQFIVFEHNRHQIPAIRQLAHSLGVDKLELKTAQVYNFENGSTLIPTDGKYSRYKKNKNGVYQIKNQLRNKCWKMWHSCVMTWDGAIVPCCFDKDARYRMGNIRTQTFAEIWNGEAYINFRQRLFSDRKSIDICENCTEGLKV